MLVQRLREIQNRRGYLPKEELIVLSRSSNTPLARIQEVISFYAHFRQEWEQPKGVEVRICRDMSCHLAGTDNWLRGEGRQCLLDAGAISVEGVSCLGRCDRAPAVLIGPAPDPAHNGTSQHDYLCAGRDLPGVAKAVTAVAERRENPAESDESFQPNRSQYTIDIYSSTGKPEYLAALKFLGTHPQPVERPPQSAGRGAVEQYIAAQHPYLAAMRTSTLAGMGGAGMPVYQKWLDLWLARGDVKYIICNGDESEPGTFKDREILLRMPHLVVEGVLLAGLMTGATAGYIFIRHEYQEQIKKVREAISHAESIGAFGRDIFSTGRAFRIEVFESPGGYICGEQSALIEAMEGHRAQPRNRPPELTTNGLFDKPTVVNNVETLAWVPGIVMHGPEWYTDQGIPGCKGKRFFSISGDLERPGVYEMPIGVPLGKLIEAAGGVRGGRFKAVATSGPSAGFLPSELPVAPGIAARLQQKIEGVRTPTEGEMLKAFVERHLLTTAPDGSVTEAKTLDVRDLPLDLNFFRNVSSVLGLRIELMLGAGLVVYNEHADMLVEARNATQFYRNESCGKCVPCRIGSQKLVSIGTTLLEARSPGMVPQDGDFAEAGRTPDELVGDVAVLARTLSLTSICGLGQIAANPMSTVLAYFPEEWREKT